MNPSLRRRRLLGALAVLLAALLWVFSRTPADDRADGAERVPSEPSIDARFVAPGTHPAEARTRPPGGPSDAEGIWQVAGASARDHLARALAAGLELRGEIPALQLVLVGGDPALLRAWSKDAVQRGVNVPLQLPPIPPNAASFAASTTFRDGTLRFLGLADRADDWGQNVRVAILDTGIAPHAALADARLVLARGSEGSVDDHGHGTAVAALLAGRDSLVHSLAPAAELLIYKILDAAGNGDAFTTAAAIVDAVDRGAQIINLSAGSPTPSTVLRDAVDYATQRGVVIVAAVGNEGVAAVNYPAAYADVVAVGAIDANGQPAPFSNTGPAVDLAAPGVGLYAAYPDDRYIEFSGTSAAAPVVSAALAALISLDPLLSAPQAVAELLARADDIGLPGPDPATGAGLLDPLRVINRHDRNLTDLGVSSPALQPLDDDPSRALVSLNAENRGNLYLATPFVTVEVDGLRRTYPTGGLSSGESVPVTFEIDRAALTSEAGVSVRVESALGSGQTDLRAENDGYEIVLRLEPGP